MATATLRKGPNDADDMYQVDHAMTNAQAWAIVSDVLHTDLIGGTERSLYHKYLENLKKPFSIETII